MNRLSINPCPGYCNFVDDPDGDFVRYKEAVKTIKDMSAVIDSQIKEIVALKLRMDDRRSVPRRQCE